MPREGQKRIDVYVPTEVFLKFKEMLVDYKISVSEVVNQFIKRFVEEQENR